MIAYCIKQTRRAITNLLLASFLIFTILIYGVSGPWSAYDDCIKARGSHCHYFYTLYYPYLTEPWPFSYVTWLFNTEDTTFIDPYTREPVTKGIDITIGSLHIRGSGALTGDLGESIVMAEGRPLGHPYLIGPHMLKLFILITLFTLTAMLIAIVQRWRRRNNLYPVSDPESYVQTGNFYYYPPSPLTGWYNRGLTPNLKPTFRVY